MAAEIMLDMICNTYLKKKKKKDNKEKEAKKKRNNKL